MIYLHAQAVDDLDPDSQIEFDPQTRTSHPADPELIERVAKTMMKVEPQVFAPHSAIWDPGPPLGPGVLDRRLFVLRLPSRDLDERGRPLPLVFAWPYQSVVDPNQMAACARAIGRTIDVAAANEILRRRKLHRNQKLESNTPEQMVIKTSRSFAPRPDTPIPPERRRAIVVLDEPGYRIALNRPGFAELRDDAELAIVRDTDRTALAESLRSQGLLVPGKVLTQNPADPDLYLEPAEVIGDSALARSYAVTEIAIALGAKRVSYRAGKVEIDNTSFTFDGDLQAKMVEVQSRVKREMESRLESELQSETKAVGGPPNIAGAHQLMIEKGLERDPNLSALVRLREGQNPITEHTLRVTASREVARNLEVTARAIAQLPVLGIGGNLNIRTAAQTTLKANIELAIEF